ncbi:MAG: hypothetical protein EPN37_09590 [Chitinophagaceae bacterium]|nr:MAG: hypothetical protein EPN37_09590 [Chitinophagaceae bacterium]
MVARFISGKSIEGALRYNEQKAVKGKAACIAAAGYPIDKELLSFHHKLARLNNLAALNSRVKTNCVHISLNFDPSEDLSDQQLCRIADFYMKEIRFSFQPYLVYRHDDAAHPHIHIVSTNIQPDGKRIALHNIGRNQSEEARKKIEKIFGLVPAESRKKEQHIYLKPVASEKVIYGKSETKAAISNVVREVIRSWKFTSLAEYNAILKRYNVMVDSGKEGSRMKEKGGLVYVILDEEGNKTGVPIKASSIYTKPTLARLKPYFEENKERRKPYSDRIKNCIDSALENQQINCKEDLQKGLAQDGIQVIFRENAEGRTYGVTFLDMKAKVVFNGSDWGKAYSASGILKRLGPDAKTEKIVRLQNEKWVWEVLQDIDFSKGFASALAQLYAKGIVISRQENEDGEITFCYESRQNPKPILVPTDKKMNAYLLANEYSLKIENSLKEKLQSVFKILPSIEFLKNRIEDLLEAEKESGNYPLNQRRKKKRSKPNW